MTSQGHDFAASQQGHIDGYANGTDSRAAEYGGSGAVTPDINPCNQPNAQGQTTCAGQTLNQADNPQQYYGMSQVQLEDQARVKATTDDNAQYAFAAHQSRPDYDVRKDDPLFRFKDSNQNKMVNLEQSYAGCKDIAYGGVVTSSANSTCQKTGTAVYQNTTCHKTDTIACSNSDANQPQPFTAAEFTVTGAALNKSISGNALTLSASRSQNCNGWDSYVTFNITDTRYIGSFYINSVGWDDSFFIEVNGTRVLQAKGSALGTDPTVSTGWFNPCEYGAWFSNGNDKDLKPYLRNGSNTIRVWNKVGGGGGINVNIVMTRFKKCTVGDTYAETCDASFDKTKATLVTSTCTQGPTTVNLGYETATRTCTKWDNVYKWEDLPTYSEEARCQTLRDSGCTPNGSTCTATSPSGWCSNYTMNFTCTTEMPEKTLQVCGDTLVCPDGNCYDQYKTTTNNTGDFLKSATYIAMMKDMKQNFDPNQVTIWKGEFQTCSLDKTLVGSNKCCTGGTGFINQIGVTCTATEQKIQQAKKDQRVTQVRTYDRCGASVAGVCVKWVTYYDFCLWPSKLARIVQDQGRPMLGQTIDNPCPGFKLQNPNELAGIHWDQLDLSDYYSDVTTKYNATPAPSGTSLQNQMQQSQQAMQQEYSQKMEQYYGK